MSEGEGKLIAGQAPVFLLKRMLHVNGPWLHTIRGKKIRTHAIVCVKQGAGELFIDGTPHRIENNQIYLLTPGMNVDVRVALCTPFELYYWAFAYLTPFRGQGRWGLREQSAIPGECSGRLDVQDWAQIEQAVRATDAPETGDKALRTWQRRLSFEMLLCSVMKGTAQAELDADLTGAVRQAADYMSKHFMEDIKFTSMAEQSGTSPGTFSRLFKKTYGMPPSDYLTLIRIGRAKELLAQQWKLRDIAQHTGFCDEFYLSRTFKKWVGVSPSTYMKGIGRSGVRKTGDGADARVAATYVDEVDHLLALGFTPVAVPADHTLERGECPIPYLMPFLKSTEHIGCESMIRKDALQRLKPDMIIAGRFLQDWGVSGLEQIAATYYYFWEVDWRITHRELAVVLGQEERAERNIRNYDHDVLKTRDKMYRQHRGKRVVFLETTDRGVRVSPYTSNGGWLLYQQLGLEPASVVTINRWDHFVQAEEVADIRADYVIIGRRSGSQPVYSELLTYAALGDRQVVKVPRYPWAKGGPIAYAQGIHHIDTIFENLHK